MHSGFPQAPAFQFYYGKGPNGKSRSAYARRVLDVTRGPIQRIADLEILTSKFMRLESRRFISEFKGF